MRENRPYGSEGGEGNLPDPYRLVQRGKDVDARDKRGHDGGEVQRTRLQPDGVL